MSWKDLTPEEHERFREEARAKRMISSDGWQPPPSEEEQAYQRRRAMWFIPPGFVSHEPVLQAVLLHLFPDVDPEGEGVPNDKATAIVVRCLHHLRGLLYEGRLAAFYAWQGPPAGALAKIDQGHWLSIEADRQLYLGEVSEGRHLVPLLFEDGAIETALEPEPEKLGNAGGRPQKIPAAARAYAEIYPDGHEVTGDPLKVVAAKVGAALGEKVSIGTMREATKTVQKPYKNPL